jgi:pimeloyl-ACP methyl ester carboxylesterase
MRRRTEARTAAAARIVGGETYRDHAMRAWVADAYAQHPASTSGLMAQLRTMAGWSSLPWLHRIGASTLALAGGRDRLAPPINGRIFRARMPHCETHVVPGAGHLFLIDQTLDAGPVIEAFLARAPPSAVDVAREEALQG